MIERTPGKGVSTSCEGTVAAVQRVDRLAIDGGEPVRGTVLEFSKGAGLLGEDERQAALEVLQSGSLFRYYGPNLLGKVSQFERALEAFTGSSYAVATSSGTAALRCSLAALGVGCGDEVIVPAFTFIATVNAVVVAGAVPVFAEVDDSLGLDPADVAAKINPRTAAVVAVHLENVACDMDPLLEGVGAAGCTLIEGRGPGHGCLVPQAAGRFSRDTRCVLASTREERDGRRRWGGHDGR